MLLNHSYAELFYLLYDLSNSHIIRILVNNVQYEIIQTYANHGVCIGARGKIFRLNSIQLQSDYQDVLPLLDNLRHIMDGFTLF